MKKSKNKIGIQTALFSQQDFLANPFPQQENEPAPMTAASSGLKLCESFKSSGHAGLFLKTFLASQAFWSHRVTLKWKAKRYSASVKVRYKLDMNPRSVQKYRLTGKSFRNESWLPFAKKSGQQDMNFRQQTTAPQSFFVFQLVPSTLPTEGIGFGLLLTALASDCGEKVTGLEK